jgi:hypothetical protein
VVVEAAYRQVVVVNVEHPHTLQGLKMKIRWLRAMKWMAGRPHTSGDAPMNVLKMLEGLPNATEDEASLPDVSGAMWRNYDLDVDFNDPIMVQFRAEHEEFLVEYKTYLKTRAVKSVKREKKRWREYNSPAEDEGAPRRRLKTKTMPVESPKKKKKTEDDADSEESDWGNAEHADMMKSLIKYMQEGEGDIETVDVDKSFAAWWGQDDTVESTATVVESTASIEADPGELATSSMATARVKSTWSPIRAAWKAEDEALALKDPLGDAELEIDDAAADPAA